MGSPATLASKAALRARLAAMGSSAESKAGCDGVTSCTSVESSSESKVGLLDSEDGATLDGHDICANKLKTAVAYGSSWSSWPEFTQVCTEAMGALGEGKPIVRVFAASEH
jgi:hypothetical protein